MKLLWHVTTVKAEVALATLWPCVNFCISCTFTPAFSVHDYCTVLKSDQIGYQDAPESFLLFLDQMYFRIFTANWLQMNFSCELKDQSIGLISQCGAFYGRFTLFLIYSSKWSWITLQCCNLNELLVVERDQQPEDLPTKLSESCFYGNLLPLLLKLKMFKLSSDWWVFVDLRSGE